tara:strand:+ start:1348 stop:1671 length:324 start_codon:yes stop_codon:yes gene_type:complete
MGFSFIGEIMSITFKSKIPSSWHFGSGKNSMTKVRRIRPNTVYWSTVELSILIQLRALGLSYKDCGIQMNRTQGSCVSAVDSNNLYSEVDKKRKALIKEALNEDKSG